MGKLFAWLHPKNDGIKLEGEEGSLIELNFDPRVPENEIRLLDEAGHKIQTVDLKTGKPKQKRGR